MAQTAFTATNVHVAAAPPTVFLPSSNGAVVPVGGLSWQLAVTSSLYAAGSAADMAIEYEYSGVWRQDVAVGGFTLGPYTDRHGNVTSTNFVNSSIGSNANPYPSNVRLRVDSIPAGTLDSVTLTIN